MHVHLSKIRVLLKLLRLITGIAIPLSMLYFIMYIAFKPGIDSIGNGTLEVHGSTDQKLKDITTL